MARRSARTVRRIRPVSEEGVPDALDRLGLRGVTRGGGRSRRRGVSRRRFLEHGGRPREEAPGEGESAMNLPPQLEPAAPPVRGAYQTARPLFESFDSLIWPLRRSAKRWSAVLKTNAKTARGAGGIYLGQGGRDGADAGRRTADVEAEREELVELRRVGQLRTSQGRGRAWRRRTAAARA